MKRKLLIIVTVLLVVIILLLNSFTKRTSNKYLSDIPVLLFEMQRQKDRIEKKLDECSTEECNKVLKEKANKINTKYSNDLFRNEFDKVKNKEITCDVSEGVPIKVIFSPKFTSIDDNHCLTLEGMLMATQDIKIDSNNDVSIYIKYQDNEGKTIDVSVNKPILPNKIRKNAILAGEKIDLKALECIDSRNAKKWINFEKVVIITEKEYNNIKIKLFD